MRDELYDYNTLILYIFFILTILLVCIIDFTIGLNIFESNTIKNWYIFFMLLDMFLLGGLMIMTIERLNKNGLQ